MLQKLDPIPQEEFVNSERSLDITISDSTKCKHELLMRGIHEVYCTKCDWGIYVGGIEDYEKLRKWYGANR